MGSGLGAVLVVWGLDAATQRQQARHDARGPVAPGRGIRPGGWTARRLVARPWPGPELRQAERTGRA